MATNGRPVHPGAYLRDKVLPKLGLLQGELADRLGVTRSTLNDLLNERRDLSIAMSLRLERTLGAKAERWLAMQQKIDLYDARAGLATRRKR